MTRGDKTVVYQDKAGEWRWKRVAGNGQKQAGKPREL